MNRTDQIRKGLRLLLGGRCRECGTTQKLEIQHVDGCTWVQRKLNTRSRWYRYLKEYREGVRLELLCRSCNGALNQWTYGTREARA
jgi:hypothetical protein